jgi:WD40 repeat protein
MVQFTNENIIKLTLANYPFATVSQTFDKIFNKQICRIVLQILDNETFFGTIGDDYTILTGHTDWIPSLALINKNYLISASDDYKLKIWELKTNTCIKTLDEHTNYVSSAACLPNDIIASCSWDKTIKLWNAKEDYICIKTISLTNIIQRVFVLKGSLACSTFYKNKFCIIIFDASNNYKICKIFKGHSDWITSLISLQSDYFATASRDETIKIWNYYDQANYLYCLSGHTEGIRALIFNKSKGLLISGSSDKSIKFWNEFSDYQCSKSIAVAHRYGISSLLLLSGALFASGSYDKTVKVWSI